MAYILSFPLTLSKGQNEFTLRRLSVNLFYTPVVCAFRNSGNTVKYFVDIYGRLFQILLVINPEIENTHEQDKRFSDVKKSVNGTVIRFNEAICCRLNSAAFQRVYLFSIFFLSLFSVRTFIYFLLLFVFHDTNRVKGRGSKKKDMTHLLLIEPLFRWN